MTACDDLGITVSQREAIEELKRRLRKDVDQKTYENNYIFYRFLKARDFNLNHAESMLRKHLQWRKAHGVDTIIDDYKPPEVLTKYLPVSRFAFDKEGSIVRYLPLGIFDVKGIRMSVKYSDLEKTVIREIEIDEKLTNDRAKNKKGKMPGYVYIYDMKNLSFALACDKKGIEDLIRMGKMYQDNYPERLKAAYIINDGWKEEFSRIIDADQLPVFLGGKKTDPDGNPLCQTLINHGSPFPEKYYLKNSKKPLSNDPNSKRLILPRASFSEISLDVKVPGSLMEWEFETKSKDIAFGVFLKENDGEVEKITELVPLLRFDTDEFSETGMYRCDKPGTYVLLFDNSYSWIRSKEIFYKTSVVTPKEHEAQLKD